jgi:Bacterial pre-peptidase C-terminal domain/Right handed beta helix region
MSKSLATSGRSARRSPHRSSPVEALEPRRLLATFIVSNVNDTGPGSLRQALLDVAGRPGSGHFIEFGIPGAGPHRIVPRSALPTVAKLTVVDGFSQPGAVRNTNPPGQPINAVLRVVLDGTLAGRNENGLQLQGDATVRGLVIQNFNGSGIAAHGGNNTIVGNFIGVDSSGSLTQGNGTGVLVQASAGDDIGGLSPGDRNLISGNRDRGIWLVASSTRVVGNFIGTNAGGDAPLGLHPVSGISINAAQAGTVIGGLNPGERNVISGNDGTGVTIINGPGVQIQGNYIGTSRTGAAAVGNLKGGVLIRGGEAVQVGGPRAGEGNVISGNQRFGLLLQGSSRNRIQGNFVGTTPGSAPLANQGNGVVITQLSGMSVGNLIGGTAAGEGNVIASNTANGVLVMIGPSGNAILGNSIFANGQLGIDLSGTAAAHPSEPHPGDGVTGNDLRDPDSGSNGFQNYPNAVLRPDGSPPIKMRLRSMPATRFRVELFEEQPPRDPSGHGEGRTFLSALTVTTDNHGKVEFAIPAPSAENRVITATATNLTTMDTSEFSGEEADTEPTDDTTRTSMRLTTYGFDGALADIVPPAPPGGLRLQLLPPGQASNVRSTTFNGASDVVNGPPGFLYALRGDTLFMVDEHTGDATTVGQTGLAGGFEGDLAVHPVTGQLYGAATVADAAPRLFRINTSTGQGTDLGAIASAAYTPFDLSGLAFVPASALGRTGDPVLIGVDSQLNAPGFVFEINPANGQAGPRVQLSRTVGATLGVVFDEERAQLLLADGSLFGTNSLYRLNPVTGALTLIGPLTQAGGSAGLELSRVDDEPLTPPVLLRRPPQAGLVFGPTAWSGGIDYMGDADEYFLPLDPGQFVSIRAETIGSPALALEVKLLSPHGQALGAATTAAGGAATLEAPATEGGNYRLLLRDTAGVNPFGHYRLSLTLNVAAEAEERGGAGNDSAAAAQPIAPSFIPLPTRLPAGPVEASRAAVAGRLASDAPRVYGTESFERNLGPEWSIYTSDPERGRSRTLGNPVGAQALGFFMWRDNLPPAGLVLNEAVWTVNLTGATSPTLSFFHSDWGDTEHPMPENFTGHFEGDGIAISNDGVSWHTIFTPPAQVEGTWVAHNVNLAAEAAEAGMTLGPDFRIKLQQYDSRRFPPNGGRGWDELRITEPVLSQDWYAFTAAAGERLSVALDESPAPPADLLVELFDGSMTRIGLGSALGDFEQVIGDVAAPGAGTYYVKVSNDPAAARAGGDYTLLVARGAVFEAGANESFAAAQSLGTAGRATGLIAPGSSPDADWYQFQLAAGQAVELLTATPFAGFFEPGNTLDPVIELYGPSGALVSTNDSSGADGLNARLAFVAPAAGAYRVRVAAAAGTSGEYVLSVRRPAKLLTKTGDSFSFADVPQQVLVTFSDDVSGTVGQVRTSLRNLTTGVDYPGALLLSGYDAATKTASFEIPEFSLAPPNGNYRATLFGANLADAAGNPAAGDFTVDFFALTGDLNRDRSVNGSDFAILAGNFGRTGMTYAQGDLNGDGTVGGSDFALLAGNFGKAVPATAATTPAPAAASAPSASARRADAGTSAPASPARRPAPKPLPRRRPLPARRVP